MRSKFAFGLVATLVLVFAFAPSSFAQVNLTIFPNPATREINTNHTAEANDLGGSGLQVSGAVLAAAPLTTTFLRIDYPVEVTSGASPVGSGTAFNVPPGDAIRVEGQTGIFASASVWTVDYDDGIITIGLPGGFTPAGSDSGSFRLVGVRLDAEGTAAPVQATATLSSGANNYILTTPGPFTVITDLQPGIGSLTQAGAPSTCSTCPAPSNEGTATIFTNRNVSNGTATFLVTEGFGSAWRTEGQLEADGAALPNGHEIRLTFGGIPTGVSFTVGFGAKSDADIDTLSDTTIDSSDNEVIVSFNDAGSLSTSATDFFEIQITGTTVSSTATLTPGSITVTATMHPIDDPLETGSVPDATAFPKFAALETPAVTVINIQTANTTMLIPFAVRDLGFDTGISIANTSADPFGASGGGATPQSGTIRVDFFPRAAGGGAGTAFTLTTGASARPGVGLSADGTLAAGATWTVLLSELLTSASQTGNFTGYLFFQTGFLLAHGTSFVTDFRSFTSFSPVLILETPTLDPRTATESLSM
jgi:hypothetical protein